MTYEQRLMKILGTNDPFWYNTINNFITSVYTDKEKGVSDLEKLAKDKIKFNEFTKQLVQRKDNLEGVKEEFFSVQTLKICKRLYNGHYGKGSIFNDTIEVILSGNSANINASITFCVDEKVNDKATLEIKIPFNLNEEDIGIYNNLVNEIKNKYIPYNIESPRGSISEYLKFIDVEINNTCYAVQLDDELLKQLKLLLKVNIIESKLLNYYNDLIK